MNLEGLDEDHMLAFNPLLEYYTPTIRTAYAKLRGNVQTRKLPIPVCPGEVAEEDEKGKKGKKGAAAPKPPMPGMLTNKIDVFKSHFFLSAVFHTLLTNSRTYVNLPNIYSPPNCFTYGRLCLASHRRLTPALTWWILFSFTWRNFPLLTGSSKSHFSGSL